MNSTIIYKALIILLALLSFQGFNIILNPEGLASVFALELLNQDTQIGLRADLGGFFVGGGLLLLYGAIKTNGLWVRAVAVPIACILVGRVYGVAVYGYTQTQGVLILLEVVMVLVYLLAANNFDKASEK